MKGKRKEGRKELEVGGRNLKKERKEWGEKKRKK